MGGVLFYLYGIGARKLVGSIYDLDDNSLRGCGGDGMGFEFASRAAMRTQRRNR